MRGLRRGLKRAQGNVIVVVLLILVVLALASIVWVVVKNLTKEKSEEIETGQFLLGADIESFELLDNYTAEVVLRRNSGKGNVTGVRFVFKDIDEEVYYYSNSSYPDELETKTYTITNDTLNVSDLISLTEVVVYYIYRDRGDAEKTTYQLDKKTVGGGGGGGSSSGSGGNGETPCTKAWANTNEYRCAGNNREVKQANDCDSEIQWVSNNCFSGYACYDGRNAPLGLCINSTQQCTDSDRSTNGIDFGTRGSANKTSLIKWDECNGINVTDYYCYYNNQTNQTEIRNQTFNCVYGCGEGVCTGCVDADGDKYNVTGGNCGIIDCDDSVASCNIDCTSLFYFDYDNDLFGNSSVSHRACDSPPGYVSNSTDCNDNNASINPGRNELCNGIDDDCDWEIDEDYDFSNSGCTVGTGVCEVTENKVCDLSDGLGTICNAVPGTPTEIPEISCYDGEDNDCDGSTDGNDWDCGAPEPQSLRTNISQYGITWFFDKNLTTNGAPGTYQYGIFVSGDYWVKTDDRGIVNVTAVDPAWDGARHGSMINPVSADSYQGYINTNPDWQYNDNFRAKFPLAINSSRSINSLISTRGLTSCYSGGGHACLADASVLTIVNKSVPSGTFRPPYINGTKELYDISQIQWNKLPLLPYPSNTNVRNEFQTLINDEKMTGRLWLDHGPGGQKCGNIHPSNNMYNDGYPAYQNEVYNSRLAIMVMLDTPQRQNLTIRLIQYGIDQYFVQLNPTQWWGTFGGFGGGRKWPILFAGIMFNDSEMQSPRYRYLNHYDGNPNRWVFGEDHGSYYGSPNADYPLGKPSFGALCPPDTSDCRADPNDAPYFYMNYPGWIGSALAAHLMNAEDLWNHTAYFDLTDRWVNTPSIHSTPGHVRYLGWHIVNYTWVTYRGPHYPDKICNGEEPLNPQNYPLDCPAQGETGSSSAWAGIVNFFKGLLSGKTGNTILTGNIVGIDGVGEDIFKISSETEIINQTYR